MKPTIEQIHEWSNQAARSGKFISDQLAMVCELAAQWGYEQAQQTTEPELPYAVGEVLRIGRDSHGRPWHEIHWYDPNVDEPHGSKLFTATQMHDHYQAGVRAGMEQSQDAKLNYAPLYDYAQANRISYNELCTAVHAAMQGDKQ